MAGSATARGLELWSVMWVLLQDSRSAAHALRSTTSLRGTTVRPESVGAMCTSAGLCRSRQEVCLRHDTARVPSVPDQRVDGEAIGISLRLDQRAAAGPAVA